MLPLRHSPEHLSQSFFERRVLDCLQSSAQSRHHLLRVILKLIQQSRYFGIQRQTAGQHSQQLLW
jgi:hypothetical protein